MTYDARNANGLPRGASVENCADGAAEYDTGPLRYVRAGPPPIVRSIQKSEYCSINKLTDASFLVYLGAGGPT